MQVTADFDSGKVVRSLLRRSRQGALATLMAGTATRIARWSISPATRRLADSADFPARRASKNILADARVSLMLDERATGDPWKAPESCWPAGQRGR